MCFFRFEVEFFADFCPAGSLAPTLLKKHSPYTTPYLVEGASPRQPTLRGRDPKARPLAFLGEITKHSQGPTCSLRPSTTSVRLRCNPTTRRIFPSAQST